MPTEGGASTRRARARAHVGVLACVGLAASFACDGEGDSGDGVRDASADASGAGATDAGATGGAGGAGATGGSGGQGGAASDAGRDAGDSSQADAGGTLAARHPGDVGLRDDPAVLFFDDFESGWGRWDAPSADTAHLHLEDDAATARGGSRYLRSTVTTQDLAADQYISSSTRVSFAPAAEIWWRFNARFVGLAPNPHHWVRVSAGRDGWNSSGLANTVPNGNDGFWFDLDANNDDQLNFYVYWYKMRSGRCNDGSVTPGCEGDQGSTYHYGNTFRPPGQQGFARDAWVCIEIHAKANSVGSMDGELSFFVNDVQVGEYRPGVPNGTWLRDSFHTNGCTFSACVPPTPFEGFDFRSSDDVLFRSVFLDAYYERDSSASKRAELESRGLTVSDSQTILYDDVVVARQRIGCVR